jgi:hypothetical protein
MESHPETIFKMSVKIVSLQSSAKLSKIARKTSQIPLLLAFLLMEC